MAKEENLRSEYLYKILLILLKYIPLIISLFYIINTLTAFVGTDIPVLNNIAGMSLFTWLFMYISTWVFRFCIYHRMFLYYILITDIVNITDYYIGIPVSDYNLIIIHGLIIGISLFLILYFYVTNNKKTTTSNSR
jgi:hypothetical protein